MLENIESDSFLILSVLVFTTVLLLLEGAYLLWKSYKGPEAKKIQTRLRALSASRDNSQQTQLLKQRMLSEVPAIERFLLSISRAQRLDRFILQAGLDWTVSSLMLSCVALGVTGGMLMMYGAHQPFLIIILAGALFASLPLLYVSRQRSGRLKKFEHQLPEALDLITRALRSGHAFASALQMVGEEMAEPIAAEFGIVHDEVNFGVSLQQAMTNLSERIPLTDLRYFIVSVLIQRDSGGNLTEVLSNLSRLIRERLKLMAKVKVLSSEGRLSAWVLGVMPFALAGFMYLMNPAFMAPLWKDPIGITIIQWMLILMVSGAFILMRIIKIRV
ncbi:MAG: type II secretion system F family protein [Pseudomonadota bacterium]|nr:type II secretion system F family protein [Pseudomonadota bacterium]